MQKVNEILLKEWDPLHVKDNPTAQDEYRSHASKIFQMLQQGRDAFALASYLRAIESGMLARPANEIKIEKVVGLLLSMESDLQD